VQLPAQPEAHCQQQTSGDALCPMGGGPALPDAARADGARQLQGDGLVEYGAFQPLQALALCLPRTYALGIFRVLQQPVGDGVHPVWGQLPVNPGVQLGFLYVGGGLGFHFGGRFIEPL